MGEIADMIMDGILCQSCGAFMGSGDGFPVSCPGCRRPARKAAHVPQPKGVGCGNCGRVFPDANARDQHYAQKKRNGDLRHQEGPKHKVKLTP